MGKSPPLCLWTPYGHWTALNIKLHLSVNIVPYCKQGRSQPNTAGGEGGEKMSGGAKYL